MNKKNNFSILIALILPIIIFGSLFLKDLIYADVFTQTFSDNEGMNLLHRISTSLTYGTYLYIAVLTIGSLYFIATSIMNSKAIIKYKKEHPEDKESLNIVTVIRSFTSKRGAASYLVNATPQALKIRNTVMSFGLTILICGGLLTLTGFLIVESNPFSAASKMQETLEKAEQEEGIVSEVVYLSFPYPVYLREMITSSELVNLGREDGRVEAIQVTPVESTQSKILYFSNAYPFELSGPPYYNDPEMDAGSVHVMYEVTYIEDINLILSIQPIS